LDVELVLGKVGKTLAEVGAGVNSYHVPVNRPQHWLVSEELGHQLEFENELASAVATSRDLLKKELVRRPQRFDSPLLWRVAQNLGRVITAYDLK
jgi:hypothetical protein